MRAARRNALFGGFLDTSSTARRLWALRPSSEESHTYRISDSSANLSALWKLAVRLTDHTALASGVRAPQPGRCGHFDGSAHEVTVSGFGDGIAWKSSFDWTCVVRFRPSSVSSGTLAADNDTGGLGYRLRLTSGTLELISNGNTLTIQAGIAVDTWYTLALTYDSTAGTATGWWQVDDGDPSKIVDAVSWSPSPSAAGQDLLLGNVSSGTADRYSGYMSAFALYAHHSVTPHSDEALQNMCKLFFENGHDLLYWFEDGAGTKIWSASGLTVFDEVVPPLHGTLTGTASTFHEDTGINDLYSRQNEYGYTEGDGSNGAAVGEYIPRCENSDLGKDTNGNNVQYAGKVSYGPIVSSPAVRFNGTNQLLVLPDLQASVTSLTFVVRSVVDDQELLTLDGTAAGAVTVVSGVLTFGGLLSVTDITVDGQTRAAATARLMLNNNN